jgi:hypothetical protein
VLGGPEELALVEKPVPDPGPAEVLVRIVWRRIPTSQSWSTLPISCANNIYVFGTRGEGQSATHRAAALMGQRRFDAKLIHTHTFPLAELPTALRCARDRVEDAIKVVVKMRGN